MSDLLERLEARAKADEDAGSSPETAIMLREAAARIRELEYWNKIDALDVDAHASDPPQAQGGEG